MDNQNPASRLFVVLIFFSYLSLYFIQESPLGVLPGGLFPLQREDDKILQKILRNFKPPRGSARLIIESAKQRAPKRRFPHSRGDK
ncbi:MAG: hypothetical protein ACI4JG_09470 [Acutalibacteraceae bacterium]